MGAGRSGTTALSIFIGGAGSVKVLGELHQLPEYVDEHKRCSCGELLNDCKFWRDHIVSLESFGSHEYKKESDELERHKSIFRHYLPVALGSERSAYDEANANLFKNIGKDRYVVLDSSKYIGRALALSRIDQLDIYVIYLVRDPRGVVDSFGKGVQTSRNLLSASLYYLLVNIAAEIVSGTLLRGKVLRLRYEDLLDFPVSSVKKIGEHCEMDIALVAEKIARGNKFVIGHMIGGNRLVNSESIVLRRDISWRSRMPRYRQLFVYILTLPIALINRYIP